MQLVKSTSIFSIVIWYTNFRWTLLECDGTNIDAAQGGRLFKNWMFNFACLLKYKRQMTGNKLCKPAQRAYL